MIELVSNMFCSSLLIHKLDISVFYGVPYWTKIQVWCVYAICVVRVCQTCVVCMSSKCAVYINVCGARMEKVDITVCCVCQMYVWCVRQKYIVCTSESYVLVGNCFVIFVQISHKAVTQALRNILSSRYITEKRRCEQK